MEGVNAYDLQKLIDQQEAALSPWVGLTHWIEVNGAWLAFGVIIITLLQILINVGILAYAMSQEGPAAGAAFIFTLLCSGPMAYQKVARRSRREREREQGRSEACPELLQLTPKTWGPNPRI